MFRLPSAVLIVFMLLISTTLQAASSFPKGYCFFGRWDLRTAKRAVTVNSGSYVRARFSGSNLNALFDVSANQPAYNPSIEKPTGKGSLPTIAWQIDDGKWQEAEIAETVSLAEGLSRGQHTVMLMVRGLDEHQNRWKLPLVASVTFTGFGFAKGGKLEAPFPKWRKPTLSMEFFGDSITEGVLVQEGRAGVVEGIPYTWTWLSDARSSYAALTAMALGAEWRQVGFGATGLVRVGSGGALGALEAFNFFYEGCPRDDWQADVVVVNHGTNEPSIPPQEYQELYTRYIKLIRTAYPKAKIVALRPFNGSQEANIKAAVEACKAAGDTKVFFIDTTAWYSGSLHPNAEGSILLAEKLVKALKTEVLNSNEAR